MNIVLNTDEANVALTVVTAQVLDHAGLSEPGKRLIRDWRRDHAPGTTPLDGVTERLNVALGNLIDERTRRMMRLRGNVKVREGSL